MTTSNRVENSTQWLETTLLIIEFFAEKGDVVNAEEFEELKNKVHKGCFCIEYLNKGLCESQQSKSLEKDILGGATPDAETYSLMTVST